ncbi:MAG: hypothetical protein ABIG28_01395 [archaeon]
MAKKKMKIKEVETKVKIIREIERGSDEPNVIFHKESFSPVSSGKRAVPFGESVTSGGGGSAQQSSGAVVSRRVSKVSGAGETSGARLYDVGRNMGDDDRKRRQYAASQNMNTLNRSLGSGQGGGFAQRQNIGVDPLTAQRKMAGPEGETQYYDVGKMDEKKEERRKRPGEA